MALRKERKDILLQNFCYDNGVEYLAEKSKEDTQFYDNIQKSLEVCKKEISMGITEQEAKLLHQGKNFEASKLENLETVKSAVEYLKASINKELEKHPQYKTTIPHLQRIHLINSNIRTVVQLNAAIHYFEMIENKHAYHKKTQALRLKNAKDKGTALPFVPKKKRGKARARQWITQKH
eukprot:CAMPEP_0174256776 /NCGR_PEP_ID=MMETSP0439-20130205/5979_1 /TAXON_ID=0 /ORGANISM="Stereomyxa ramosa, Strain Chinc5" /LENGTH=178 /DNA_ID=CAMNT_0015339539 /DNA_START=194 /DNA_END=730 /DNA_ORIENTATION=-